jgi:hypothetical protein
MQICCYNNVKYFVGIKFHIYHSSTWIFRQNKMEVFIRKKYILCTFDEVRTLKMCILEFFCWFDFKMKNLLEILNPIPSIIKPPTSPYLCNLDMYIQQINGKNYWMLLTMLWIVIWRTLIVVKEMQTEWVSEWPYRAWMSLVVAHNLVTST